MQTQKRTAYFLLLSLLVAGCLMISPAANAGDTASGSSQEVTRLLADVKTEAVALEHDADVLAGWTRAKQADWRSHGAKLNEMKDHINQAGQVLAKLHDAKATASSWQQEAINRIAPLLKQLADNTTATINHLNDNQSKIHFAPYTDYARANYDLAQGLAALVSNYVEFGEHESEFHRLQDKLEPAAG